MLGHLTIIPCHHQQLPPSHPHHHNQHHHLSATGWEKLFIEFVSLLPLSTATKNISPINLLHFSKRKIADTLFSEADCSKLPPVINKQRDTGRARGKQKDRSSVALIGTTSHTIQKCRSVPISNSPVSLRVSLCPAFSHFFVLSVLAFN